MISSGVVAGTWKLKDDPSVSIGSPKPAPRRETRVR